ncbi:heparinase II/III family protein [Nitrospira calida]|jgi:uncharacterized heparinase superfamily protein
MTTWVPPIAQAPCLIGPTTFRLLNETDDLDRVGWDGPPLSRLWRYHQHYFDDLRAVDADQRASWHERLLLRWVEENPPGKGVGWESYPTARRIVNWIKWALAGHRLPPACLASLAVQARWLRRRLEYHLLGNHLLADAKALIFAGSFLEGPEADRWRTIGLRLLGEEVAEQILADGGHIERSPMYQALVMEDLLDIQNVLQASRAGSRGWGSLRLEETVRRMMAWLATMTHPDGDIAFFNDAAIGMAPSYRELAAYATRLGFAPADPPRQLVQSLPVSGYVRLAHNQATVLLDVAPLGPDYLLGHAHADTLSFELSVGRQRVLVNSGTSCYGESAERVRQRGTAAHNTVVIDGENSSEVWKGFRVARRAYPIGLTIEERGTQVSVACAHTGYGWLPGRPRHRRHWRFQPGSLDVCDTVEGQFGVADARFHWHPSWTLTGTAREGVAVAQAGAGGRVKWIVEDGDPRIEPSSYHPRFGVTESNHCLVVRLIQGRSRVRFLWS